MRYNSTDYAISTRINDDGVGVLILEITLGIQLYLTFVIYFCSYWTSAGVCYPQ